MQTRNSIDLTTVTNPCWALSRGGCTTLSVCSRECGSYMCPFYKPEDCKEWVRIEDEEGIYLIPPEEYKALRKKVKRDPEVEYWKVSWRSH